MSSNRSAQNRPAHLPPTVNKAGFHRVNDILYVLSPESNNATVMRYVAQFAARHQAHLTVLFVRPYPVVPFASYGQMTDEYLNALDYANESARTKSYENMESIASDVGIAFEWAEHTGGLNTKIAGFLECDFILTGRLPTGVSSWRDIFMNELIVHSGRPVIVVPDTGRTGTIAEHIMVAWDGSKPAARAVNDSLPILKASSGHVRLLGVPENSMFSQKSPPAQQLAWLRTHLERHGVSTEPVVPEKSNRAVSHVIERTISFDQEIDLLVMGAWGHTRTRERALGGVTRYFLERCDIPVLFSH